MNVLNSCMQEACPLKDVIGFAMLCVAFALQEHSLSLRLPPCFMKLQAPAKPLDAEHPDVLATMATARSGTGATQAHHGA